MTESNQFLQTLPLGQRRFLEDYYDLKIQAVVRDLVNNECAKLHKEYEEWAKREAAKYE